MPHIYSTWLAATAKEAQVRKHNSVISVSTPDGVTISAVEGDHADSLGRNFVALGQQVLELNGTDHDALIVKAFLDGEGLGQSSAALFHRFIAYREGAQADPLNELVVAELAEVDQ